MSKPHVTDDLPVEPDVSQDEDENFDLVEHLRMVRARRAYEKLLAIRGTIDLKLDIDEVRGRNRR